MGAPKFCKKAVAPWFLRRTAKPKAAGPRSPALAVILTSAKELIAALQDDPAQAMVGWACEGGERALLAVLDAIRRCW